MSIFRNEMDNARLHILTLWGVIIVLALFLAFSMWGWARAPRDITFHVPPDLAQGATVRIHDVPKANVYSFAFYMWQQIHRWPTDGEKDYPKNIFSFAAYITPRFQTDLLRSLENRGKRGELVGRSRALFQVPGTRYEDNRVDIISPGVWTVWIDAEIEETVAGMEVKRARIRYPLRVVQYDVDREANPWGMALDGYAADPAKLPDDPAASETPSSTKDAQS